MAGGFKMPFIADVSEFLGRTKNVEDALADVADALDDVGSDGDEAARKLERQFSEAAASVTKDAKRMGDGLGDTTRTGMRRAGENVQEFKQEAKANLSEVTSSFQGDMTSAVDGIQGTLGGLAAGFSGPLGAAVAGAAVGVGLVYSRLELSAEEANALKDRIIELASEISTAGGNLDDVDFTGKMRDWGLAIKDAKSWWEMWQDSSITNIEAVQAKADEFGLNIADLFQGMSGYNTDAATRSWQEITDQIDSTTKAIEANLDAQGEGWGDTDQQLQTYRAGLQSLRSDLEKASGVTADAVRLQSQLDAAIGATTEATERAKEVQDGYLDSLANAAEPVGVYEGILQRKQDAERESAEATAAATEDATDSWSDYAKDVAVTLDDMIADLNAQAEQTAAFNENLAKIAALGGQAVADGLREQGPEAAAATAELLAQADPAKFSEYVTANAKATGAQIATQTAAGIEANQGQVADAFKKSVDGLGPYKVPVEADVTADGPAASTSSQTSASARASTAASTAVLADEDRALLRQVINAPAVTVEIPVTLDGAKIAEARRTVSARANTSGRRAW